MALLLHYPIIEQIFIFLNNKDSLDFGLVCHKTLRIFNSRRELLLTRYLYQQKLTEIYKELGERDVIEYVQKKKSNLKHVAAQTLDICLAALNQNGFALKYVKEQLQRQSPEICLGAVNQTGYALQYVKDQTPEICLAAVTQYGDALQYVKDQTPEICLAAVNNNGYALVYVKEQLQRQSPEAKLFSCC